MFRVTRYPMISKTELGRVGYQKKYRVAGRVRVPAGHCQGVKGAPGVSKGVKMDVWGVPRGSRGMLWVSGGQWGRQGYSGGSRGRIGSQGVKRGVRGVPGVEESPRDPKGLRGTSREHQGVHGALGISQGVKGDFRGVRGTKGTPGVSRWGGHGESRGSKVLRGKSGVYHGVKAVARGFQGVSWGPRGSQGYPGGIFSYCVRACAYTQVLARVYSTHASTCTIYTCFTLPHTRVNLTGLQL